MSNDSGTEEEVGVLVAVKDAALKPFRFAVSKPAQRAYISTILIALTSITLLGTAATAYILFYYTYVPVRGFSRPIHLQFESEQQPYGAVSFSSGLLVSGQPYDVQVSLHMPRTAANRAAGNFMLDLQLFAPDATGSDGVKPGVEVLVHQRRPAILTYYSPTMEHVHRAAALPWYILGFRQESEVLDISLMEGIEFSRGWRNIPASARIELQSQTTLQVYSTELIFKARLRGLRYMMYNYRITSFLALTGAFWVVEMAFAGVIWLGLVLVFSGDRKSPIKRESEEDRSRVKDETPEGSERQKLSSTPQATIKSEEHDGPLDTYPLVAEADDEDDEAGIAVGGSHGNVDSGIGTSMESSSTRPESVRRRGSRTLKSQGG